MWSGFKKGKEKKAQTVQLDTPAYEIWTLERSQHVLAKAWVSSETMTEEGSISTLTWLLVEFSSSRMLDWGLHSQTLPEGNLRS
jgi:hypothetical protein